MKIRFLKSPSGEFGLAYFVGDTVEMENKQAQTIIDAGYAVAVDKKIETATEPVSEIATEPAPKKAGRKPQNK